MDKVREFLRSKLEERGLKMAAVSRDLGRNPTYIQQFLTKGSPRDLPENDRRKLAKILDVPEAALREPQEDQTGTNIVPFDQPSKVTNRSPEFVIAPYAPSGGRDLPVLGAAQGGTKGLFMSNGDVFDMVERPGNLAGVRSAYAVYMVGDSMEPRYYAGWLLGINPNKPFRRGHAVVVQIVSPDGSIEYLVKEFVRQTEETLTLRQLNPEAELHFPRNAVRAVHRVTGSTEDD